MSGLPETEISLAVRADAEAARAEIRAAGIACPSCGVNMADLPRGHRLAVMVNHGREKNAVLLLGQTARCAEGEPLPWWPESYEVAKAAANIMLWDDYNSRMDAEMDKIIGPGGGAGFSGLLGMLQ